MDIRSLIPKDKGDTETAEKLKKFSYSEIKPIIPDLLEWIQDMNWPVARPVAEYLQALTNEISPEILKILQGDDIMWKYWVIDVFGGLTQNAEVINEIKRIATKPTEVEIEHEIDEQARHFLGIKE